jgi:hypothetical protein
MRWAIVSDKIETFYESDVKVQYGGDWGTMNHVPVPENMDWTTVSWNGSELVEDPAKVQAKTDAQWVSVRAQQSQKLYESDWTCSVVDPPAPILAQRDQWVAYRQALRDVTKQSDPFAIQWPPRPSGEP